eukprot:CAMPEP_0172585492 /NCGR_PEP_ID=MMETSP1068-20121228/4910_1 /TAXON_ID=35684 /ORGANISM="Pseudopedinella elastica, Strain CCMP716" /LENGTH=294 /DNA_ID=CAMNT_0013379979 /DNA_START=186 /DNA_END=1067 /DNA_ORIENTATION=+
MALTLKQKRNKQAGKDDTPKRVLVNMETYKRRNSALQAAGKAAMRDMFKEGGQSTVKNPIAWPWVRDGNATEFNFRGVVELWDVPADGLYLIGAHGASGADVRHLYRKGAINRGGGGAMLACMKKLNKGQQLAILAGGEGGAQYNGTTRDGDRMVSGGGGGASCVMIWHTSTTRAPLLVAAGGGGASCTSSGIDADLDTHGKDAPATNWVIGGSGGMGQKVAAPGKNAIPAGSGRGGEAYFAGGGSGFYGDGGMDRYFQQPGPAEKLSKVERRLARPPASHQSIQAAAAAAGPH